MQNRLVCRLLIFFGMSCGLAYAQQVPYNPYSGQPSGYNPYGSSLIYIPPTIPLSPQNVEDCSTLEKKYEQAAKNVTSAHEDCLNNPPEKKHEVVDTDKECSKYSCQPLHVQMNAAKQDASRIDAAYNDCMNTVISLKQQQEQQTNAGQGPSDGGPPQKLAQKQSAQGNEQEHAVGQAKSDAVQRSVAQELHEMELEELARRTAERTRRLAAIEKEENAVAAGSHEADDAQKQIAQLDQDLVQNNPNPLGTAVKTSAPSEDDFVVNRSPAIAASSAQPPKQVSRPPVGFYYNGRLYPSYNALRAAARASGNCASHPELGEEASCDKVGAQVAASGTSAPGTTATKKGAPVYVSFAFSEISSVAVELSGSGSYGVGISRNQQTSIDVAMNSCIAGVTTDIGCSTAGTFVGSRDGSLKWYALALNLSARPVDDQHIWSDGEAIGYDSKAAAEQNAMALCHKVGADDCAVVLSGPVGGSN